MDVTALTHVISEAPQDKDMIVIDQAAFAEEMNKYSAPSDSKESPDLAEDLSQSLGESEVEESLEEEELAPFSLIHPFLRLQTEIDSLSHGHDLKTLHIENSPIDNEISIERTNIPPEIKELDESIAKTIPVIDGDKDENLPTKSEDNKAIFSETSAATVDLDKPAMSESDSKVTADLTKDTAISTEVGSDTFDFTHKTSQIETAAQKLIDGEQTVSVNETKTSEETGKNNDSSLVIETVFKPNSETVIDDKGTLILETDSDSQTEGPEQLKRQSFTEVNIAQPATDRQMNAPALQPAEATPLPVTKEQSVEIIQDLMMTVVTDESGKEVFKSTLTLTPESLGEVKIELTYNQEGLSGKLVFESDETRKWMESHWQQLKQPLETKGLTLNQFDFSVTEPIVLPQTDGFSFSQEFDQSEQQKSNEPTHSSDTPLIIDSEEEATHLKPRSATTGLNIYA